MVKFNSQKKDLEIIDKMSFSELQAYIHNLLSVDGVEIKQEELMNASQIEDEINQLINLLKSKILEGLITKGQKSVKTLQQELFRFDQDKERLDNKNNVSLSDNLQKLHHLRDAMSKTELTQNFLERAYSQMCSLQNEFFDIYYRNKYRDTYSFSFRLNLDRKQYSNFAKELPFLVNQAIEKMEIAVQKQKKLQLVNLSLADYEKRARNIFEKEIDQKSNGGVARRHQKIVALRSRKKKIFTKSLEDIPVKKLPWEFFPKGQWTVEQIVKEFGKYVSQNERVDESRIWKVYDNLNPSDCYISQDGFNRYIAFCFDWTEKVVLECPIYGNAIYVVKGDWKEITKLHKWQASRLSQVTVIRHSDTWFSRLKSNLKSPY